MVSVNLQLASRTLRMSRVPYIYWFSRELMPDILYLHKRSILMHMTCEWYMHVKLTASCKCAYGAKSVTMRPKVLLYAANRRYRLSTLVTWA